MSVGVIEQAREINIVTTSNRENLSAGRVSKGLIISVIKIAGQTDAVTVGDGEYVAREG